MPDRIRCVWRRGSQGTAHPDLRPCHSRQRDDVVRCLPPQHLRPQKRAEAGEQDNRNRGPDGDEQRAVVNAMRAIERGTDAGRQQARKGTGCRRVRRGAAAQYLSTKSLCIVLFGENPAATPAIGSRSSEPREGHTGSRADRPGALVANAPRSAPIPRLSRRSDNAVCAHTEPGF